MSDRLVPVGSAAMHIRSVGYGSPAVVFDSAIATDGSVWTDVLIEVGAFTQACAYDRLGTGSSTRPASVPHTNRQMAEELHLLLDEAAIPGPYVLVGHSLGGVNVRLFAGAHPDEVAGMVLVDSADDPMQLWSLMPPDELAKRKEELRKVPEGIDFDTFVAGTADMRASNRSIGDKPLVVLTRGKADAPPTASPDVAAAWLRRWQEQQSALPRLSTNSVHVVAEKSAHAIHQENPGLVVEAIREVVTAVRDHGRVDAGRLRGIAAS